MIFDLHHFKLDLTAFSSEDAVHSWLVPAKEAHQNFIKSHQAKPFSFIESCLHPNDDKGLEAWATHFSKFDEILIFGTGGSSLGGRALRDMQERQSKEKATSPILNIITNIDPPSFDRLVNERDWRRTGVIAISKSGETAETMMQLLVVLPLMRQYITQDKLKEHLLLISEPGDNSMRRLGRREGIEALDHPPNLGGRYSVLSIVGILPALLAGLDTEKLRQGARDIIDLFMNTESKDNPILYNTAMMAYLNQERRMHAQVMLCYSDRLGSLARWHRQLWAESLGKKGQGTTPIYATGPVDQHSQLQLWLDGPDDKFYTVLGGGVEPTALRINPQDLVELDSLAYMKDRSLGELMRVSRQATTETLIEHKRPVRQILMNDIHEYSVGALMMYFMLETVLTAMVYKVDPFDQPAVEHGKQLIRTYLKEWT